ncbi:carbohydrate sulfotransferase 5-like isoform X2 [Cololabis saira]|uniref:carbohydrate sulfotransferase 5-like isoform X2 n=1 Tax=Cololabis saira TaxID=129043 RepID=UPI002AD2AF4D|nr:carbohydrate sulfotransferase 5-like isoform X2 [Cololabis saira]
MMSLGKVKFNRMIFLLILQGLVVVLFYGCYVHRRPPDTPPSTGKVHVLVLSSWRSGSSFMGQVFSQHPSVFYLMEPAWHVWSTVKSPTARLLRMAVRDLMRSIFQCDFSVMDSYLPEQYNLFMWSHSRALCSPPACPLTPRNQMSSEPQCFQKCDFQGLQKDPKMDLRIIHLVRDPRAVLRSREESAPLLSRDDSIVLEQRKVPAAEVQYQVIQEICRSHVRINERAVLKPPPFLKGRYKLVRYEDVARNPLKEVNDIYEFVGLGMTPQLEDWIYTLTHGEGKGPAFQVTSRNATNVSQAWRTMLPYSKVKRVQEVCEGAMSLLGYKTVKSEEEQKRLDIDLLVPQEPYQLSWVSTKKEHKSKR